MLLLRSYYKITSQKTKHKGKNKMTNETQTTTPQIRRALVIDDSPAFRYKVRSLLGNRVDCIDVTRNESDDFLNNKIPLEESLRNIDSALRNRSYQVILMDGDLRLGLGEEQDGVIISKQLRNGKYGSINQTTPILNTSDSYENPFAIDGLCKELHESDIARLEDFLGGTK